MLNHLRTVLGVSAFCLGLAAIAASASETRNSNFAFTCDGTNKTVSFTASGLGNNTNRFIQSAEVALFENRGGLQYVIVRAQGDPNKQLVTLAGSDNSRSNQFTGFYQLTTSATGTVTFTVDGACNGGFGQVQGLVTIGFFS
jgi:hypothetical protein